MAAEHQKSMTFVKSPTLPRPSERSWWQHLCDKAALRSGLFEAPRNRQLHLSRVVAVLRISCGGYGEMIAGWKPEGCREQSIAYPTHCKTLTHGDDLSRGSLMPQFSEPLLACRTASERSCTRILISVNCCWICWICHAWESVDLGAYCPCLQQIFYRRTLQLGLESNLTPGPPRDPTALCHRGNAPAAATPPPWRSRGKSLARTTFSTDDSGGAAWCKEVWHSQVAQSLPSPDSLSLSLSSPRLKGRVKPPGH